jgi:hypothetical protein
MTGHYSSNSTDSNLQDEMRDKVTELNDELLDSKNSNPFTQSIQLKATRKFSKSLYVKTSTEQTKNLKKSTTPNSDSGKIFANDILTKSERATSIYQRQASVKFQ